MYRYECNLLHSVFEVWGAIHWKNQEPISNTDDTTQKQHCTRNSIGTSSSGVALHFEKRGHSSHNFTCFAIEKVVGDCFVLAARERFYIDKMDVISKGMNTHRT